MIIYSFTT